MYIEFILTLQTIFFAIFIFNYIDEQNRRKRLYQEILSIIMDRTENYINDNFDPTFINILLQKINQKK